jgi:urease accessory protein
MIRAFPLPDAGALVHLHNVSGGVLGGDQLEVVAHVGAGARAQMTTTGATRVYRQRADRLPAVQSTHISVAPGGLLEYLPDPLIPFADANFQQRTIVELSDDAGLFAWDVVTPGREARGERFAYDQLHLETRITVQGRPIAWEQTALYPARQDLASTVRLGAYRTFATLLVCRTGLPPADWRALEEELAQLAAERTAPGEALWGVSTLVADGLIIRGLAVHGRKLVSTLPAFWRRAKQALYGLEAVMPRKIY